MPSKTQAQKAAEVHELFDRANGVYRRKWRALEQRSFEFYLNNQLSAAQITELENAGMPSFIINRITPVIEIMKYFVTANNPRWKAVGVTGDDSDIAAIHGDIADYCWYISNGTSLYPSVVLDSLTKGVGYFMVDIDKDMDRGKGEVVFKRLEPFDVFVDPQSTDILFRDAGYIIVKKNYPRSQLARLLPQFKQKIMKASGNEHENDNYTERDFAAAEQILPGDVTLAYKLDGEEDQILEYFERYYLVPTQFVNVLSRVPLTPEEQNELKSRAEEALKDFQEELSVSFKEQELQFKQAVDSGEMLPERAELEIKRIKDQMEVALEERRQVVTSQIYDVMSQTRETVMEMVQFNELLKNPEFRSLIVNYSAYWENRLHMSQSVGRDIWLGEYTYNISTYNIVPIPYTYTGTPFPMSAVTPLIGKQQEINKAHQIMIHNANLSSNLRWLYTEGSIPEKEWEEYSSSPGALLKYRQGFDPPTPVQPLPLNNAFYSITQEGKSDIEYISGIHSSMMGVANSQPDTYRGQLANDEYGTRRIKAWMNSTIEPALEQLGKVHMEMARAHYTAAKVFRIVQPENGMNDVKEAEINIPIWNDKTSSIQKYNDYQSAKMDVRVVAGSTMPVNRWALLEEYFRWFQAGLIDDIAMLKETDIRDKSAIINRQSQLAQARQQLEQMEEEIKQLQGDNETLSRQIIQSGIRHEIDKAKGDIDAAVRSQETTIEKETLKTQAEQSNLRAKGNIALEGMKKDISRAVKDANKDVAQSKK
jgi:hypothetical protein